MRVRELTVAYRPLPGPFAFDGRKRLSSPREAAALLVPLLSTEAAEVFGILCLSSKHTLIAWHEVSRGTLDTTLVHPREVFKAAILANTASLVLVHNHPSGDPTPSPDDVALTNRLVQAGQILGIEICDHIVIGHDSRYFSFLESGRMERTAL